MQNLTRNRTMTFRVSETERDEIRQRMKQAGIFSVRAYLLKMALDGMVVRMDMSDVQECSRLLRSVSNNVNQLAKHANSGGTVHSASLSDVKLRLGEVWERQDNIIRRLTKILEAA